MHPAPAWCWSTPSRSPRPTGRGTTLVLRLRDPLSGEAPPEMWSGVSGTTSLALVASVPATHGFSMSAGRRAIALEAAKGGAGPANILNGELTALCVPFGPPGAGTPRADQPAPQGGDKPKP